MPSMYVVVDAFSNQHRDYLTNLFQYYNKDPYTIVNDLSSFCVNNQNYTGVQGPQVQAPAPVQETVQNPVQNPVQTSGNTTNLSPALAPNLSPALPTQNYVDGYFANMYSNTIGNNYMDNSCLYGTPDVNVNYYGFNSIVPSTEYNSNLTNAPTLNYNTNQYSPPMAYTSGNMSRRSDEGFYSESSFASCSTPSNAESSCSTPPNANSVCANSPSGPFSPVLANDVSSEERTSTAGSKFALWAVLCDAIMEPQCAGAIRIVSKVLDKISFTVTDMDAATKILSTYASSPNLKGRISTYLWNAVQKGMLKKAKLGKETVYIFTETALESMSFFLEKKDLTLDDFFKTVQDADCSSSADGTVLESEEDDVSRKRGKSGVIWETIVNSLIDPHDTSVEFFGCDGYQIGFSIKRVEAISDGIFGNRGLSRGEKTRKLRILLWNGTNTQKYIERVNGSLSNYYFTERSKRMLIKLLGHKNLTLNELKAMGQRACKSVY
ncbi:unnamed protein product [Auanema sp. JU1783]|nr:unnamed protein product [Auanema sp. JU1783]